MKALGFSAIVAAALSFILWLVNWIYWRYTEFAPYDASRYERENVIRNIMLGVSTISIVTEYLAILLIAIGLIVAAKRLPKNYN